MTQQPLCNFNILDSVGEGFVLSAVLDYSSHLDFYAEIGKKTNKQKKWQCPADIMLHHSVLLHRIYTYPDI